MVRFALVAVALLAAHPAFAEKKQATYQPPQFVEDISDSSGNYINGQRAPHRPATPSNWKPYCYGGFQRCGLDSAHNHQDVNVR